jgi:hypothetical protein
VYNGLRSGPKPPARLRRLEQIPFDFTHSLRA